MMFHVFLAIGGHYGSQRRMIQGVTEFLDHGGREWDLQVAVDLQDMSAIRDRVRAADGVLVGGVGEQSAATLLEWGRHVVILGDDMPGLARVVPNELAVGAMAFAHFRDLGLDNLAYCGLRGIAFSDGREAGFAGAAGAAGLPVSAYDGRIYQNIESHPHERDRLRDWLTGLPRPSGLLCSTTEAAHIVLHHCRLLGLHVPDDLAILGVDDEDLYCELSRPRLSTIDQGADRIGFQAASLLDRAMRGGRPIGEPRVVVPPRAVIPRESTAAFYTDSPAVARAIRYIRDHACAGINGADVVRQSALSRRALERGFARNLGRTVHDEITRVRIERAKHLLHHTDMPLPDIAGRTGFSYASKLCAVFKRETGMTPTQYRRTSRLG